MSQPMRTAAREAVIKVATEQGFDLTKVQAWILADAALAAVKVVAEEQRHAEASVS